MWSKIKSINLILTFVVVAEAILFFNMPNAQAQTTAFLKRPFYGPPPGANAWFDHHCPDYELVRTNENDCNEDTTYLYTYPNPDQNLNGLNRFLGYDGRNAYAPYVNNKPTCPSGAYYCYSGHSGHDYNIHYVPVVASAPGEITASQWQYTNHEVGYGLYVVLKHSSTHRTIYGHLSALRFPKDTPSNTNIPSYWQIGTSGTTGNSSGSHLHFELQYNDPIFLWTPKDMFGWSGPGTNPCRPGITDPWECWTGVHSEWLWLPNPEQTLPTYNGDYPVDNDDGNLPNNFVIGCNAGTGQGNCPYWELVSGSGYNNDLRYTLPNGTTADYWAKWIAPNLPSTGQYEIEVRIPYWDVDNRSHAVRYEVVHNGGTRVVVVDQHEVDQSTWISLGRYDFNAGSSGYVRVTDASYVGDYIDPLDSTKKILVDVIRWRKTH